MNQRNTNALNKNKMTNLDMKEIELYEQDDELTEGEEGIITQFNQYRN